MKSLTRMQISFRRKTPHDHEDAFSRTYGSLRLSRRSGGAEAPQRRRRGGAEAAQRRRRGRTDRLKVFECFAFWKMTFHIGRLEGLDFDDSFTL